MSSSMSGAGGVAAGPGVVGVGAQVSVSRSPRWWCGRAGVVALDRVQADTGSCAPLAEGQCTSEAGVLRSPLRPARAARDGAGRARHRQRPHRLPDHLRPTRGGGWPAHDHHLLGVGRALLRLPEEEPPIELATGAQPAEGEGAAVDWWLCGSWARRRPAWRARPRGPPGRSGCPPPSGGGRERASTPGGPPRRWPAAATQVRGPRPGTDPRTGTGRPPPIGR